MTQWSLNERASSRLWKRWRYHLACVRQQVTSFGRDVVLPPVALPFPACFSFVFACCLYWMYIPFTHVGTDMYVYQAYQALPYRIDVHMYLIRTNIFTRTLVIVLQLYMSCLHRIQLLLFAPFRTWLILCKMLSSTCVSYIEHLLYLYSNLLIFITLWHASWLCSQFLMSTVVTKATTAMLLVNSISLL